MSATEKGGHGKCAQQAQAAKQQKVVFRLTTYHRVCVTKVAFRSKTLTFENPRAKVDGLADKHGVIFLDPKEDQRLLPQLYKHLKTEKYIQLDGDFINRQTNAFIPLRLVVHLSRIDMSNPETIVCEFDSAHISTINRG